MSYNKFTPQGNALAEKVFRDGLDRYTQANCQITLTDKGYRIYRPPNLVHDSSTMHNMWGGLIIRPFTADENFYIKGHTYIVLFHVSGQSSNAMSDIYINNNAGWGGGSYGLTTELSDVAISSTPANFKGEHEFSYKFTVSGDIWKTCATSYSSFVAGTSYNCYRDLKVGFGYTDTGELGTDLYITNLRCYDITTPDSSISIEKSGVVLASNFVDGNQSPPRFYSSGEIEMNEFIEY